MDPLSVPVVPMLRPRVVLLMLVAALGCNRSLRRAQGEWADWFEDMVRLLPRADAPSPANRGEAIRTRDGLTLRLDGFQKRNDNGCWHEGVEHWPGPGWRDVCVGRVNPEGELPALSLQPGPSDPSVEDQLKSGDWNASTVILGGRRAVVERARISGGMAGARRERRMTVVIELGPRRWARLQGRTGDDAGYAELLAIAATIEER